MSLAYRIVFECPSDHHNINLQKNCTTVSLTENEAMTIFGDEGLSCPNPRCGWYGKASKAKLLRILPFNWVLSFATLPDARKLNRVTRTDSGASGSNLDRYRRGPSVGSADVGEVLVRSLFISAF